MILDQFKLKYFGKSIYIYKSRVEVDQSMENPMKKKTHNYLGD